jgi:heme exporter protein B
VSVKTRTVVAALVRKDLQLELRTREAVPAMALFSISTFVLFHFGLDASSLEGDLAAGVLWVTLLFAAVLAINRLFVAEREQGGFDGFLLAPVDRTALFMAKATVLFTFLCALELAAVPAFVVLLLEPSPWAGLPELVLLLALANAGIAVVGTLVGALAVQTRARDLIVPLLALPLMIPVVIAAARGTAPLWLQDGAQPVPGRWPAILGLYDLVFGLLAYAVFDYLLDE